MTKEDFAQRITTGRERMYRISRGYLHNECDCLDAVSEAILKAWQKRNTLLNPQYFDTWITRILIRECVNIQRKQKQTRPVADLPEKAEPPSNYEELRQALDALPQKLRSPIVLHYMEGYGVKDIAQILRTPKGTVCSRLHEARMRMRQFLEEEDQ
jgi:RNA polymerase sigma-70 factor, ECF subfamily